MRGDDLTVSQAAEALGTSPQTVRALLRKGELPGRKEPWGSRYVWVPSREGVDEFLSQYGRLDGHRRRHPPVAAAEETSGIISFTDEEAPRRSPRQWFIFRPRGRATVVVVVLGVPLLLAYAAARILPTALWFDELGRRDLFGRIVAAKVELNVLVIGAVALFIGVNLAVALRGAAAGDRRAGALAVTAASVVTGSLFASSANGHWQTFLLWRHRQSFGVDDPILGKDVGYFVFSLPFELLVAGLLLWLVGISIGYVALVYVGRGAIGLRPLRGTLGAQVHLACLVATFLLVVVWRLRLAQYTLELRQPATPDSQAFAGAGYVDVNVRLPGLVVLMTLAVVLAVACVAAPFIARAGSARRARWLVGVPAALLIVGMALVGTVIPALVQRFVVDPNPLLSEQPYLERSIGATRTGLGLDAIDVAPYSPTGGFTAADIVPVRKRLDNVLIWDGWLLEARMRQLVTDTPYYSPQEPTLDIVKVHGRRQPTLVSARELDLGPVGQRAETWISDRIAYTHGLGLIRFSGTDIEQNRQPRLLDTRREVREPRIYFGNLPQGSAAAEDDEPAIFTTTTDPRTAESPWVLVNTRRPEVDVPGSEEDPSVFYHYDGPAGIELSDWVRRTAFAFTLGSKELLLSDDITDESRILLHRDVQDRLQTLAPFIRWDTQAVPLTADGRIVFVVDGYTTSDSYPYAERVDLGGTGTTYARATVRATVDAFTGDVELYRVDETEPIARAWAEAFPTLFRPAEEMPAELRARLRYPADLFAAQATAYERFHTTRPDLFVSDADAWSRPIALSGPIEVAGDVDFDESDEDDLRLTLQPAYTYAPPPGSTNPRLVLGTYYTPRSGQNLVASLSGWIDDDGRARLAARDLPRDPVTLGPAQVSRHVFASPRVRNLLGLRNLEIRDLQRSSLDSVLLGRPHLLFLPGGVIQIQSLYEGSRGPGAARLIGVTAYLNGRVGFGITIDEAVRQALNEPPRVDVLRPAGPVVMGEPVKLEFVVENAQREVVTITSSAGTKRKNLAVAQGRGTVSWVPTAAGDVHLSVDVVGLDGSRATDSVAFPVLSPPPRVRLVDTPKNAVVGEPLRVAFKVTNGVDAWAKVSTRSGIELTRRYLIRRGTAVVRWTPKSPGPAVLLIRAHGRQGQTVRKTLRIEVAPRPETPPPPTVSLLVVPEDVTVGVASEVAFRADGCRAAVARIEGPESTQTWRFPCPARRAMFSWTPTVAGRYLLTAVARGSGITAQTSIVLTAEDPS